MELEITCFHISFDREIQLAKIVKNYQNGINNLSTLNAMNLSKRHTPLRYPGGKAKFAPFVKSIFEENGLVGGHYLEPYAGGAAVALELLFSEYVSDIHINDFDSAIYDFWYSAIYDTEGFLQKVRDTEITMSVWLAQREILRNPQGFTQLERGFATFFMNRTNRSGILKGGVIGGLEQAGIWKLDVRFNKVDLMQRIERIALYKDRIHIHNEDAQHLLLKCHEFLPEQSLIYLDPPYYVKGQGLYRNFYRHDDHVGIKNVLANLNRHWLVSYDDAPEIREIYKDYRQDNYILKYSAQIKKSGSEVLIFGDSLATPSFQDKKIA